MGSLATRYIKFIRLFLPQRERFTRELFHILAGHCTDNPIWSASDSEQAFFLEIEFVEVVDSILFREVVLGFKLADNPQYPDFHALSVSERSSKENPLVYRFELGLDVEVIGEQTFLYTFTSIEQIDRSIARFRRFVEQSYIPREQARQQHYERWLALRAERRDQNV